MFEFPTGLEHLKTKSSNFLMTLTIYVTTPLKTGLQVKVTLRLTVSQ
jgi:hypothetical protein